MFFALSEQLDLVKGIQMSHDELRRTIVQHLWENPRLVSTLLFLLGWIHLQAVSRRICPLNFFIVLNYKVISNKALSTRRVFELFFTRLHKNAEIIEIR